MSTPLKLPEHQIELIHESDPFGNSTIHAGDQSYAEIQLKGPHTIKFNLSSDNKFTKILYNFDWSQQCASTSQPASSINVVEATRQGNTSILIDPTDVDITTRIFPDKYQYQKTYYPGLTTIDQDFNTVTHQLSVTIAQPSFNDFVEDVNLLDVRSFTNISNDRGKAVILLEDVSNNWVVPVTLYGERQYTSTIGLGETVYGRVKFDVCLQRAPYANTQPSGLLSEDTFAEDTVFMGGVRYGTHEFSVPGVPMPGAVREEFTITNTGEYVLYVTEVSELQMPFYMESDKLVGMYSPSDSGCDHERSVWVYYNVPDIEEIVGDPSLVTGVEKYEVVDTDVIDIDNSSENSPTLKVRVTATTKAGYLKIEGDGSSSANPVEFEPTLLGETASKPVSLVNTGSCPVKIFDIEHDEHAEIVPDIIT